MPRTSPTRFDSTARSRSSPGRQRESAARSRRPSPRPGPRSWSRTSTARAEEAAAAIRDAGGNAIGVACDVTKEDARVALVAAARDKFGRIDLLVNNAAWISGQVLTVSGGGLQEID